MRKRFCHFPDCFSPENFAEKMAERTHMTTRIMDYRLVRRICILSRDSKQPKWEACFFPIFNPGKYYIIVSNIGTKSNFAPRRQRSGPGWPPVYPLSNSKLNSFYHCLHNKMEGFKSRILL